MIEIQHADILGKVESITIGLISKVFLEIKDKFYFLCCIVKSVSCSYFIIVYYTQLVTFWQRNVFFNWGTHWVTNSTCVKTGDRYWQDFVDITAHINSAYWSNSLSNLLSVALVIFQALQVFSTNNIIWVRGIYKMSQWVKISLDTIKEILHIRWNRCIILLFVIDFSKFWFVWNLDS